MWAFPQGRALPVAVAFAGAVVGTAAALAVGAASQIIVKTGGVVSPFKPVPVGGSKQDRIVGGTEVADSDWEGDQLYVCAAA